MDEESTAPQARQASERGGNETRTLVAQHLRIGWWAMVVFVTLGVGLEALHAFKAPLYLGVDQGARRLMWTLGHAHGIGLSLVHVAFAATLSLARSPMARGALASRLLTWAVVLLPAGFFLGGAVTYDGDPGVGIILAPVGALAAWVAVVLVALDLRRRGAQPAA